MADEDLPREAVLHVRLIDATDPEARLVVTETTLGDLGRFPIEFELPSEGVQISRHHRYELEAEIVVGDETIYHIIPSDEWCQIWLPALPECGPADRQRRVPGQRVPGGVVPGLRHASAGSMTSR